MHKTPNTSSVWHRGYNNLRTLKRPSSEAATIEEARRTLRYVESLSDVRTKLEDFFSILLKGYM